MERLFTIQDFCRYNGIGRSTVYREHQAGRLPFVKVGRATRIRQSDMVTWQKSLEGSDRV